MPFCFGRFDFWRWRGEEEGVSHQLQGGSRAPKSWSRAPKGCRARCTKDMLQVWVISQRTRPVNYVIRSHHATSVHSPLFKCSAKLVSYWLNYGLFGWNEFLLGFGLVVSSVVDHNSCSLLVLSFNAFNHNQEREAAKTDNSLNVLKMRLNFS